MIREDGPLYPIVEYVANLEAANESQAQVITQQKAAIDQQEKDYSELLELANKRAAQVDELDRQVIRAAKIGQVIGALLAAKERRYPYVYGGDLDAVDPTKRGLDCSALQRYGWEVGASIALPRTSKDQATKGVAVGVDDLLPGDGLFFDTNGDGVTNHCGTYLGDGLMLHTANKTEGIAIVDWKKRYGVAKLTAARRFL